MVDKGDSLLRVLLSSSLGGHLGFLLRYLLGMEAKSLRFRAHADLGRLGRRLQEIYELPVAERPMDLYAALAEAAR